MSKTIELMDTPGILWPKFEDQSVGLRLALIGSINDNIIDTTGMALELLLILYKHYRNVLAVRYEIETAKQNLDLKEAFSDAAADCRQAVLVCKKAENRIRIVLQYFCSKSSEVRSWGKITLEFPEDFETGK